MKSRIAIAGTGNVASHLAAAVAASPHVLAGIYSRNASHAAEAARPYGCPSGNYIDIAAAEADIVIISVADSGIADTVKAIASLKPETVLLHTSGTVSKDVLASLTPHYGILYPLQSFTKGAELDMAEVPFFTEASDDIALAAADALACSIGSKATHADEATRRVLHIAGVLTNNFVNILLLEARRLLGDAGVDADAVKPLAKLTVAKAFAMNPRDAQTGPARRGDMEVIQSQLDALPDDIKPVYRALTDLILNEFKKSSDK